MQFGVVVVFRVCSSLFRCLVYGSGVEERILNATTFVDRYPSSPLPCLLRFVLEPVSLLGLRHRFPVSRFWYQRLLYLGIEPGVGPRALGFSSVSLVPVLLSYALWLLLCVCVDEVG